MAYAMDAGTASGGTGELSINEMTTGMSAAGMEQYLENI